MKIYYIHFQFLRLSQRNNKNKITTLCKIFGHHQVVCDLTIVVLINRENAEESPGNQVETLEQSCGKPTEEDKKSDRILNELVMKRTFDTLFLLDKEVNRSSEGLKKRL